MKNRRLSLVIGLIVAIMILTTLFTFGCKATTPGGKTLEIGIVANFGWPAGIDLVNMVELQAAIDNANGGLAIGGDKYNIEVIAYDSQNDQSIGEAAINRLIFEDDVKFILSEFTPFLDAWLPITEANKVIYCANTIGTEIHKPDKHYSFNTMSANFWNLAAIAWFVENFPDKMNYAIAGPDTQMGHMSLGATQKMLEFFGISNVHTEFYPADATDLSALGTKIKTLNPDVFMAKGGGAVLDALAIKAVWSSGWRGTQFGPSPSTALSLMQVLPAEALEGYIIPAVPGEFDPPLTQAAKDFKDAFLAEYGEYEGELLGSGQFECLRAGLQQAGSLDTDKVATAISNGLSYEGASGIYQMVSRPDLGNQATTDSILALFMKRIEGGKPVHIGTLDLDEGAAIFQSFYK